MRLTTKSQYGFQVLGVLVHNWREEGNPYLQVGDLAVRCQTSAKYLELVLLPLSHAGILDSKRGQHGGYRLRLKPEEVSLAEVVRHLEGRLMPIPSWAEESGGSPRSLSQVLYRIRDTLRGVLENTTIEVLAEGAADPNRLEEAAAALMYYI